MRARRWLTADLLIAIGFAVLFGWVIWQARQWRFQASLFPVVAAAPMLGLALVLVALKLREATRPARAAAVAAPVVSGRRLEEEEAAEAELDDAFSSASCGVWCSSLAWLALFFALLWALGLFVTVPLFALLYLTRVSGERPVVAAGYAVVSWLFIYGLFDQVLHVPLPGSAIVGMLGL